MQVRETSDYSIFQKSLVNRQIDESLIKKLTKSINEKNLLSWRPILVDQNLQVIDGQHRLQVAKKLGVPIYYQMKECDDKEFIDAIFLVNNQKPWKINDYHNFYLKQGHEEYEKLEKFCKETGLSLVNSLILIQNCFSAIRSSTGGSFRKKFAEGKLVMPPEDILEEKKQIVDEVSEIVEYVKERISGSTHYLYSASFFRALLTFLSSDMVIPAVFKKKLDYKLNLFHPCSKQYDYLKIFCDVYNFHNPNGVDLSCFI